jgi:hypothetical protein
MSETVGATTPKLVRVQTRYVTASGKTFQYETKTLTPHHEALRKRSCGPTETIALYDDGPVYGASGGEGLRVEVLATTGS